MVDIIACCECTVCPPAVVLRLSIAVTISFATVNVSKCFVTGTNIGNSVDMIVEHWLNPL